MITKNISSLKQFIFESENQNKILDISKRIEILKSIKKWIFTNIDLIEDALKKDLNKSEVEVILSEVMIVVDQINFYCKNIKSFFKPKKVKSQKIKMLFSKSYIAYKPLGTVFLINPFNYPFHLGFLPLITSIACGNYTIVKNSDKTVYTNVVFKKMIDELNLDFCIKYLLEDIKQLDIFTIMSYKPGLLFFTGGHTFGNLLKSIADKYNVKTILELGSACPVYIDKTANINIATKRIIWAKLFNSGQTCVSPNSVFIEKTIYETTKQMLEQELKKQCLENKDYDFAKIIDKKTLNDIVSFIKKQTNIDLKYDEKTLKIQPQIIEINDCFNPILNHEIFAPILFITKFEANELFYLENKKMFNESLSIYVFSNDNTFIETINKNYNCGTLSINEALVHVNNIYLPFGGVGKSGNGRYHGIEGLKSLSYMYSILKGSKIDVSIRYFNKLNKNKKIFKKMLG